MVSELQLPNAAFAFMAMSDEDGLDDLDEAEETKDDDEDDFDLDASDDEEEQM